MHVSLLVKNYIVAWLRDDEDKMKVAWKPFSGQIANVAKLIEGNASEFHNASVELTRLQMYSQAYQLLEVGTFRFPSDTDILGDLLLYGVKCQSLSDIIKHYEALEKINKSKWSWRAFHFSIEFLMELYKASSDVTEQEEISKKIENTLIEYQEHSKFFEDQSNREKCFNLKYEYYILLQKIDKALNALQEAVQEMPGKCPQCALQLADYYFEAGEYESVIAPATIAAMVIDVQHAIKYSYLYFILGASREYKIRKEGIAFSEENIRPIYRAYYASLVYTEQDDASRMKNIKNRIRVLEYDSGISSNIDFSEFSL